MTKPTKAAAKRFFVAHEGENFVTYGLNKVGMAWEKGPRTLRIDRNKFFLHSTEPGALPGDFSQVVIDGPDRQIVALDEAAGKLIVAWIDPYDKSIISLGEYWLEVQP